ncbi:MAG: hypothetical protein ACPLYC_01395 [Minisyncoccia bacterium]
MNFYHNLITERSWQILKNFKQKYDFILIGGWAVFLYTKSLKSKDIDIILDYKNLEKIKNDFEISKNNRLKKYEIKKEGIDIDIYLPFYSNPGLPAEEIKKYVQKQQGFTVPKPEILLILKQKAYSKRKNSIKGEKDKIDIVALLGLDIDFKFYWRVLKKYKQENLKKELIELLKNTFEIPELNLNKHKFALFKHLVLKNLTKI